MPIKVKERFLYYPLLFMVLSLIIALFFRDYKIFGDVDFDFFVYPFYEYMVLHDGLPIPYTVFVVIMAYFVGYIYGFFSTILPIKIRSFGLILMPLILFLKIFLCLRYLLFGVLGFLIEIIIHPLTYWIKRNRKKRREKELERELKELFNIRQ